MKKYITQIVDFFYFPFFRRFIPLQTFRYAVCGGMNLVLDALLYTFFFHIVIHKEFIHLNFITISPQIAAFLLTFPIILFTGFWLAKNISFQNRKKEIPFQRTKYIMVVIINIFVKYSGLRYLTMVLMVFPSIANVIMTIITVIISYILQNKFTFKK